MRLKENPWKGLQPYIDSKDDLVIHPFCGREHVVREIFDLIDNNIITTLYGKSGIGKTSLLNAGLFPKLRKEDYVPVYVRLGTDRLQDENFAGCIVRTVEEKAKELENRSELIFLEQEPQKIDYLWTYFASHNFFASDGNVKFPVIVLDQFEEVFNEKAGSIKLLLLQLRELASDRLLPNGQELSVNFRIVISIREDDLYLLEDSIDSYYIPEFKVNRYRLKALSKKEAIRVIEVRGADNKALCEKLFDAEHFEEITNAIINTAISKDPNSGINTQVLSLCCFLLYNKTVGNEEAIGLGNVKELKGNLVGVFYDEATKKLTDAQRKIFEERLVTDNNRRLAWSKKSFLDIVCNCENNPQKEKSFLAGQYAILRNIKTHGEKCVELIHDMLAEVVAERKAHRKNREKNRQRRANRMNVLSHQGRNLIDNALEFDFDFEKFEKEKKWELDNCIKFGIIMNSQMTHRIQNSEVNDRSKVSLQKLFDDPKLQNSTIRLEFIDENGLPILTSDGIYSVNVKYEENRVTEVLFFDSPSTIGTNGLPCPIYINGGFCGIRIDYNGEQEIRRTYLQWDGENFVPTCNAGGYASIEFDEFDEYGNPQKTIYKDREGRQCKHQNGNYGFLSEYDEDGFEKRRIFINEKGEYAKIISGVYGRELYYDINTGLLSKEIYLGADLQPVRDINGYCTAVFERDAIGRITKETYYDELGEICNGKCGYVSEINEYFATYSITSYRDINNNSIQHTDGHWMIRSDYDTFGYICWISNLNQSGDLMYNEVDRTSKMQLVYDDRHWLVGIRQYGESGVFDNGIWVDYNKTRTHVVRMGYLSADNQKSPLPNYDGVSAIELRDINTTERMPLLRVLLNNFNQPVKCSSGYFAYRRWEEKIKWFEDDNRTVKEMFYDSSGEPMTDYTGAYGLTFEYDDVQLIQNVCNIDARENKMNDLNGVCRIETHFASNGKELKQLFYDKNNVRCPNYDGVFEYRYEWTSDYLKKTSINLNGDGNPTEQELGYAYKVEEMDEKFHLKVKRCYYLDTDQNIVIVNCGFYIAEYLYDDNGEQIEVKNIGPNGLIIATSAGYAIGRVEKSEDSLVRKVMYLDEKKLPIVSNEDGYSISEIRKDKEGRTLKKVHYDDKYKPVQLPNGTFGTAYEYSPDGNTIVEMNLDELGKLTSDNNGLAKFLIELDEKGRTLKEVSYDIKGNALLSDDGDYGKLLQYNDTPEGNVETIISIDSNGQLMINNQGYAIAITRFDKNNRPIKRRFLGTERQPVLSSDQFHSVSYIYNEDYSEMKMSFHDIEEHPCANGDGIAEKVEHYDSEGRVILEYCLNLDGSRIPYDTVTYSVKREYLNDREWKEFYLGIDGNLCIDSDRVACLHLRKDEKGRTIFRMRYDAEECPQADSMGDYGEMLAYIDNQNAQRCTGLDANGNPHINKEGFVSQLIVQDDKGRVIRREFLDEENNPTVTISGEFGQATDYIDEHTTKTTSLDKDLNPFNPVSQGYSSEIKTIDEQGRITRVFWLDSEGEPFVDENGDSGKEYKYPDDGTSKMEINLNKYGYPHINSQGYAKRLLEYDGKNREILQFWIDVDDKPLSNANGDYGKMTQYDENDENIQTIAFLDSEGNPHKCTEGWTFRQVTNIEQDGTKIVRLFDGDNNPAEDSEGDFAYRVEVSNNEVVTYVSLDADGNPRNNKRGYAKRIVNLDGQERTIKELWYTDTDSPFADNDGDFGVKTIYDDEERTKTLIFLDKDENPRQSDSRPYSATKIARDDLGREVLIIFLDGNLSPINKGDGTFGQRIEYFEGKRFTSVEINLDAEGMPCCNKAGFVKQYSQKDDKGRILLEAYTDAEDNILTDSLGNSASGYIYTEDGNVVIMDSLDEDFNKQINKHGYAREIRMINPSGKIISVYFDLQGKIVVPKKIVLLYASSSVKYLLGNNRFIR